MADVRGSANKWTDRGSVEVDGSTMGRARHRRKRGDLNSADMGNYSCRPVIDLDLLDIELYMYLSSIPLFLDSHSGPEN